MDYFRYKNSELYAEDVSIEALAREYGTPVYVYSGATIDHHCKVFKAAFKGLNVLPAFAVKCNSNLHFLKRIFSNGFGADVVSLGEYKRARMAGCSPDQIVFSGVGKQDSEILEAVACGLKALHVESLEELRRIEALGSQIAVGQKPVPVCLRINPNVDAKTHPKITTGMLTSKFGIAESHWQPVLEFIQQSSVLRLVGLSCHIGSQLTELAPLRDAASRMIEIYRELPSELRESLDYLDLGGGVGIRYRDEVTVGLEEYGAMVREAFGTLGLQIVLEPGRVIAGNTGVLVSQVIQEKQSGTKRFVIVDAAMTELLRPALYGAYHSIEPVKRSEETSLCDVVGPVCESSDILGTERELPDFTPGDLIVLRSAGAYAASMASNYNSRPKCPEVMVDGALHKRIARRESVEELWRLEEPMDLKG